MKIAVTGANSYIGYHLIRHTLEKGFEVRALGRHRPEIQDPRLSFFEFDLGEDPSPESLQGVDVLVHLANHRPNRPRLLNDNNLNYNGTKRLLTAARGAGVKKMVFLSSQLATKRARSSYAKNKFAVEKLFDRPGDHVIRAGFVFGGKPQGFYQKTLEMIEKGRFVPVVRKKTPLNPVHIDDLLSILFEAIQKNGGEPAVYYAGTQTPVPLGDFFSVLGRNFFQKEIRTVSLPFFPLYGIAWILSWISGGMNDLWERLAGILGTEPMPSHHRPEKTDLFLREGFRAPLLREGDVFSKYLFGQTHPELSKKYEGCLQEDGFAVPFRSPLLFFRFLKIFRERLFVLVALNNRNLFLPGPIPTNRRASKLFFAKILIVIFLKEIFFLSIPHRGTEHKLPS